MKVVVAGGGAVGRHLAADLQERGHDITLIDQNPAVAAKIDATAPGVEVVMGDACELWVLEKARVREADALVAATGDDEDNLVMSLLSKQEFGVPRVLARVNHPRNEWLFTDQWGVDDAVSPPHILTSLVEEAVTVGDLVRLLRLERGKVGLVEVKLTGQSDTCPILRSHYERHADSLSSVACDDASDLGNGFVHGGAGEVELRQRQHAALVHVDAQLFVP